MIDNLEEKNQQVEEALYNTALGSYKYEEEEIYNPKVDNDGKPMLDINGDPILVLSARKRKKKWYHSSVNAQKMWLEANNPEKYGNKNGVINDQINKVLDVLTGSINAWEESEEGSDDEKESE